MQNLLLLPVDALISHGAKRQSEECECACESLPSALGPQQTRLATPRDARTPWKRGASSGERVGGEALLSKARERQIVEDEDAVKTHRSGGARLVRAARRSTNAAPGFGAPSTDSPLLQCLVLEVRACGLAVLVPDFWTHDC